jgi:hypothetical protein
MERIEGLYQHENNNHFFSYPMTMYMKDANGNSIPIQVTPKKEPTLEELYQRINSLEFELFKLRTEFFKSCLKPENMLTFNPCFVDMRKVYTSENVENGFALLVSDKSYFVLDIGDVD